MCPPAHLAAMAATATALVGMFAMLVSVALAWPVSPAVLLVCVLNFAVLTYLATRGRMPFAACAALPCLAIGYLTAVHLLMGGQIAGAPFSEEQRHCPGRAHPGARHHLRNPVSLQESTARGVDGVGAGMLGDGLLLITLPERGLDSPLHAMVL